MAARLPEDGEFSLGPVRLPAGRRIITEDEEPVAWVTEDPVAEPGRVWAALRDLHTDSGLVPVLLDPEDNLADFFFTGGVDPGEIDGLSAVEVLADSWAVHDDAAGPPPGKESDLAPAEGAALPVATLTAALGWFQAAHIGLVPAARPADVPAAVGWVAFSDLMDHRNGVWIGSVLRSFERRFGARLVQIGPGAAIRLLVERPPHTLKAARRIAAEHRAFADEYLGLGPMDVEQLAAALVDTPGWTFWWD
ncbi:DUF4253 domain-containing protein [Trebonia kvetii]|uniref:DUF4253 domain-containing protein n=1 Tax=Trebonia kvetii TaxID=2480626 RepID=A0A6P2C7D3_9ACTN|nr:DUF4253 domain-containing protein [Trebonia kvetii]TVZ06405.1 DUF4253 domain-containing protein [Trebonia kvetii]